MAIDGLASVLVLARGLAYKGDLLESRCRPGDWRMTGNPSQRKLDDGSPAFGPRGGNAVRRGVPIQAGTPLCLHAAETLFELLYRCIAEQIDLRTVGDPSGPAGAAAAVFDA